MDDARTQVATSRQIETTALGTSTRLGSSGTLDAYLGLDHLIHAATGARQLRASPVGQILALTDWALHLANTPVRCSHVARLAITQWQRLAEVALGKATINPPPTDHRFANPSWPNPPFNRICQAFLLAEEWWTEFARPPEGVGQANGQIVSFATRQWVDVFSPSNIPWLNPEVIEATLATGGRSLRDGYVNFLSDLQEAMSGRPSAHEGLLV
jgi:polyhydroxyalkanoate synthase